MSNNDALMPTDGDPWGYRGRRVVVTGAASGMGRAATEILVGLGADVVALDIQPVSTEGISQAVRIDLADPASIAEAAGQIDGTVDALFNCAGVPGTAEPRTILAINFCGLRQFTEALIPRINPGGAICSIGSTAAVSWPVRVDTYLQLLALPDYAAALAWLEAHLPELGYAYDVTKEAINTYSAWRAVQLTEVGVRMNCINPGGTRTPASRDFAKAVKAKEHGEEMLAHWPKLMGRMAQPAEQAWPMVFLNSP
ncbi:MAG: 3-alpha-hydroxysteroid dehydrogenase, partial [Acidimicrobiia bacterium]|nr:3-alpha-hydroxysteroid dehydrogenase [Acidimicrobiia bacterium]